MITIPQLQPRAAFRLANNALCLCGSGQPFQACCSGHLPGGDIRQKARVAADQADWTTALVAARADVTQYSIWHLTNTAPLLRDDPQLAAEPLRNLVDIDVLELSDLVAAMGSYYYEVGVGDDFPATLERLRTNIDHDRWRRRILYLQCLQALSDDWNEDAGRLEFKKLGAMAGETDVQILQLYLDLHGRQLGLAERLAVTDRVIALSAQEVDKLHYRCLKGATYLMVGDTGAAQRELLTALELFRTNAPAPDRSPYARSRYAIALCLCGCLRGDVELLAEAALEISQLLSEPYWTPAGRAGLLRLRGDIYRATAEWGSAKEAYVEAFSIEASPILQVFVAQGTLFADGPTQALAAIKTVAVSGLNQEEYVDYVFALAQIAVESGDGELLGAAEALLRMLQTEEPYFRKQCDSLLLSVIDTAGAGPSAERSRGIRQQMMGMLPLFTRYIKLEPNFMGIGVNLGKIIDDFSARYTKPSDRS